MKICCTNLNFRIGISLVAMLIPLLLLQFWYKQDIVDDIRRKVLYFQLYDVVQDKTLEDIKFLPLNRGESVYRYTVFDKAGNVLWFPKEQGKPLRFKKGLLQEEYFNNRWITQEAGKEVSAGYMLKDGTVLIVSKYDTAERSALNAMFEARAKKGLYVGLFFGILLIGFIFILIKWVMRPLEYARFLAQKIDPDRLKFRLPICELPAELHEMAFKTNTVLELLQDSLRREKQFVSDAAHQIRTPLACAVLLLEEGKKNGYAEWGLLEKNLKQIERLVYQLGRLTASERSQGDFAPAKTDVSRLAKEIAVGFLPQFDRERREVAADIEKDIVTDIFTESQLYEILGNLLDNALVHGKGTVCIRAYAEAGNGFLCVEDEGQSLEPFEQKAVFSRFYKADPNSPGSGLGLAIAGRIARNAGAELQFAPKRNFCLCLKFPINKS